MAIDESGPATKHDLAELRKATKQDLAESRKATKQDLAESRKATKQDLAELRKELKAEFATVRGELSAEIAANGEETRRHFDVMVEKMNDSVKLVAEATAYNTSRLGDHERRLTALETPESPVPNR